MTKNKQLNFTGFSSSSFSQTKAELDNLLAEKNNKNPVRIIFLEITLMIIIILLISTHLPPEIPLFYSQTWGEKQLAQTGWIWILPGSSLVFTIINLRISSHVFTKQKILAQILIWGSLILTSLALIDFLEIIWISL